MPRGSSDCPRARCSEVPPTWGAGRAKAHGEGAQCAGARRIASQRERPRRRAPRIPCLSRRLARGVLISVSMEANGDHDPFE